MDRIIKYYTKKTVVIIIIIKLFNKYILIYGKLLIRVNIREYYNPIDTVNFNFYYFDFNFPLKFYCNMWKFGIQFIIKACLHMCI